MENNLNPTPEKVITSAPQNVPPIQIIAPPMGHQKRWPIIVASATLVILLVTLVSFIYFHKDSFKKLLPSNNKIETPVENVMESKMEAVSPLLYKNSEYGFSINFNEDWKDYKAQTIYGDTGETDPAPSISFSLPTKSDEIKALLGPNAQLPIFYFFIQTPEQWREQRSRSTSSPQSSQQPIVVIQNDKYVYSYVLNDQVPIPADLQKQVKQVSDIIKSFKLITGQDVGSKQGLKKYINDEHHFSLEYPDSWTIGHQNYGAITTVTSPSTSDSQKRLVLDPETKVPFFDEFSIDYAETIDCSILSEGNCGAPVQNLTFEEAFNSFKKKNPQVKFSTVTVGGITGYESLYSKMRQIMVPVNGHLYYISVSTLQSPQTAGQTEEVLKSLKFLK